jgi:D-alanyl-D-alanine carboxypeptidase (penicillin-binding protein 5/6)
MKRPSPTSLLTRVAVAAALPVALLVTAANPAGADDVIGGAALAAPGVVLAPGAPAPPTIQAKAFVVADLDSGEILAAQSAHLPLPPASTLKSLTALTLLPRLDPATEYTATYEDASAEGSKVGIVVGAPYLVSDLFNGLMLPSGNDAAHALGEAAGGQAVALELMNTEARRLQALDTVAKTTSGLDEPGQLTSAYDLALIARAGLQRADFRELTSRKSADFPGQPVASGPRPTYKIYTQNRLLLNGYDGAIGVKTGYTTQAGRTFVAAAERNGRSYVVTLLGTAGRSEPAAAELLDWAFANPEIASVAQLVDPVPAAALKVAEQDGGQTIDAATTSTETPTGASGLSGRTTAGFGILGLGIVVTVAGVMGTRWL